jgi:hypothetical protein
MAQLQPDGTPWLAEPLVKEALLYLPVAKPRTPQMTDKLEQTRRFLHCNFEGRPLECPDMTLPPTRSDLLDPIHDACLEDIGFARLGSLLAEATTSANGVVVIRNGMIPVDAATTTPAEAQAAYLAYYGYIDPWAQIALQAPALADSELGKIHFRQRLIAQRVLR